MQKIIPHLWFDTQAKEAAEFYTSVFPDGAMGSVTTIHDTPSGDSDIVTFSLMGYQFMAISAGPLFTINPSISFHVKCPTVAVIDAMWAKLSDGGKVLMPLGSYPWTERYGWVQDRYGVSWQLLVAEAPSGHHITPVLTFTGAVAGRAEAAVNFYTSLFADSTIEKLQRYGEGAGPNPAGTIQYAGFTLAGQEFGAMDSAEAHDFNFNEAISLIVNCETQEEIDALWSKLSAVPEAEQCGWLKDKYGVSWQIVPTAMGKMMSKGTPEQIARVTHAFLKMKKFDIAALQKAYEG